MTEIEPGHEDELQEEVIRMTSQKLQELMDDSEAQKIAYTALLAYRMLHWAATELSALPGASPQIQKIILDAQQRAAMEPFSLQELISALSKRHLKWMRSKQKAYEKEREQYEAKIRAIEARLSRKDIPLPVHSMRQLFDEHGFRHGDMLLIFGPRKALSLVARWCATEYERVGGVSALLYGEENDPAHDGIASYRMPPSWYANAANSSADLLETLDPIINASSKRPAGLLVAADLDQLLINSPVCSHRAVRVYSAFSELRQLQYSAMAAAMILCVATDDDMPGTDLAQTYSQTMLSVPHIQIKTKESEIAGAGARELLCIGNDIIAVSELEDKLKAKEEEE